MDSSMYYARERIAASTEANVRVIASTMASSLANGNGTISPRADDGGVSMNNFYPALVQCFGIIICGLVDRRVYLAPR